MKTEIYCLAKFMVIVNLYLKWICKRKSIVFKLNVRTWGQEFEEIKEFFRRISKYVFKKSYFVNRLKIKTDKKVEKKNIFMHLVTEYVTCGMILKYEYTNSYIIYCNLFLVCYAHLKFDLLIHEMISKSKTCL